LRFDGGYYNLALEELSNITLDELTSDQHLEFTYRKARILHKQDQIESAVSYYAQVIKDGTDLPAYYACNSALQLGLIHEGLEEFHLAKSFFDKCLDIQPAGYRRSIHMQAKAGLSRVKHRINKEG
jgi:tetratricopeptide (TPR) repeat protein